MCVPGRSCGARLLWPADYGIAGRPRQPLIGSNRRTAPTGNDRKNRQVRGGNTWYPSRAMTEFMLLETKIGWCGLAWGEHGIVRVWLPEASEAATRARIRRRLPQAVEASPPSSVWRAAEAITALLSGEPIDLGFVALDMAAVPAFERRVYEIARTIPPGKTMTYGEIARRLGEDGDARDVGQAMGRNPFPIVVPCHRVLAAGGKSGGFSAPGGVETKLRLLTIEGAVKQMSLFDGAFG